MLTSFYSAYQILNKVYSEGAYISQAVNSTQIEPLKKKFVVKLSYGVLDKDIELSYYLSKLTMKNPKLSIRTLIKIALYAMLYLEKQPHTVINQTVELAKKLGKGGASGFINALLRNFDKSKISMPKNQLERLSVEYSYPLFALKKLVDFYGLEKTKQIISCQSERSFVRFNKGFDGENYLIENQIEFEKMPFENCFSVKGLALNDDFYNGVFTFQSVGSVAICSAVLSCDFKYVLDACSAPGGKAVFLADYAEKVVAFELHEHRAKLISSYAQRMKKDNVEIVCKDSAVYDESYNKAFDVVVCDVPCSGFGTLLENPDIKLKKDDNNLVELNKTQYDILSTCSKYLKTGGSLVYSTCSLFNEENDEIVKKFLNENDNFVVEEIQSPLQSYKTQYGLQFLPDLSYGVGFYVCKMKKL